MLAGCIVKGATSSPVHCDAGLERPRQTRSITVHFAGDQSLVNHIPIAEDWNYAIRMYEPEPEILDGTWTFPEILPAH
jgi:hypothetical protein